MILRYPPIIACEWGVRQRLEFLGDAVVQLILTVRLYEAHLDWGEGELTKLRATLTRRETLADFARGLKLGDYLRLGRGEELSEGSRRTSTLGDAFEAVVGAMYLDADRDLAPAAAFVNRLVTELCPDAEEKLATDNPKGILQEWAQQELREKPAYEILELSGPDHEKTFKVGVYLLNECYGVGVANRLRTAEQEAARQALARLGNLRAGQGKS